MNQDVRTELIKETKPNLDLNNTFEEDYSGKAKIDDKAVKLTHDT